MKTLLVTMLITFPVLANVEIVSHGNTDTLFVSWINASGDDCLSKGFPVFCDDGLQDENLVLKEFSTIQVDLRSYL